MLSCLSRCWWRRTPARNPQTTRVLSRAWVYRLSRAHGCSPGERGSPRAAGQRGAPRSLCPLPRPGPGRAERCRWPQGEPPPPAPAPPAPPRRGALRRCRLWPPGGSGAPGSARGGGGEPPPAGAGRQRGARGGAGGGGGVILNRGFSELGVGGGTVRRASVRAGVGRPARSAGKDGLARGVLAGERRVCGTRASWVGACFWEPSKRERGGKGKRKHYTKAPEACSAGSFYVRKMC